MAYDIIESAIGRLIHHVSELPVRMDGEAGSGRRVLYGFDFLGDSGSIEAEWPCSGSRLDGDVERLWELIERAPRRRVRNWIEHFNELDPAARRVADRIFGATHRTF
jgi:hypothetical protein